MNPSTDQPVREIRFRAWTGKEMATTVAVTGNGHVTTWGEDEEQIFPMSKGVDWPVMQYSGMQDENGVDIYEGDLCKRNGHLRKIIFHNAAFLSIPIINSEIDIDHIQAIHTGWNLSNQLPNIEVIGNIYENKNLLKP